MKKVSLGTFKTDGKLVVTDPCYELKTWCNKHLKVKPGIYQATTIYGSLKEPLFPWDEIKGNFRNAQLLIVNTDYKGKLKFTKTRTSISVDSGQAGFFNVSTYNKEASTEVELINHPYSFFKEHISSAVLEITRSKEILKQKEKNEHFEYMKKECFKGSSADTIKFFEREVEMKKRTITRDRQILKSKKWPAYLTIKKTTDFYEIQCDLTKSEHGASVSSYGAVSSSGIGDGGYSLYVAKNTKGEIVACYLEFLDLSEIK